MSTRRFLLLLAAALVVIAGALYLSSLRHLDRDPRGAVFLPGLSGKLDSITEIQLRKGGTAPTLRLQRSAPGHWVIPERDGYPADIAKIRRLLLALSDAKVVEEKTSNPASYAVLGIEDPRGPSAGGVEVTLVSPDEHMGVIIGRIGGGGSYVRRSGESKSFVVDPAVTVDSGTRDWIDTRLLDIPLQQIQSIRMKLSDGSGYSISRAAQPGPAAGSGADAKQPVESVTFKLDAVPAGREASDPASIAPSPTTYNGIAADDVAAAAGIDFSKPASAEIKMLDGRTYLLKGAAVADKHWITVSASKDDALTAKVQGRAFEIAAYRYDALFRPLEQLLKPKPSKTPAAVASKPSIPHS